MTKSRAFLFLVVLVAVVSTALVALTRSSRAQDTTAKIPPIVVTANNGANLGPVIGLDGNGRPNVLFDDSSMGGRPLVMVVEENGMRPLEFQLWFSGTGCTGTAYVNVPDNRFGLNKMTGILYAIGPGTGGDIHLYRSDSSGPGSVVNYESRYNAATIDFGNMSACEDNPGSSTLVTASEVVNLETDYPPPYDVSF